MNVLRAAAFALLVVPVTAGGFVLACFGLLFDPVRGRASHSAVRAWSRTMLAMCGARLVVTDAARWAPDEPRVLVSNHSSYLDIPALLYVFPGQLRVVARRTLLWLPFVGWYIALGGHFFVDREDPRQALALVERVGGRMRRRRVSALLFPEGTRSRDGRLGPLKSGAFFLPLAVEAPIQPVVVLGGHRVLPKGAWLPTSPGVMEIRVGPPIATAGRGGPPARKALAAEVRSALLALGVPDGGDAPADGRSA